MHSAYRPCRYWSSAAISDEIAAVGVERGRSKILACKSDKECR